MPAGNCVLGSVVDRVEEVLRKGDTIDVVVVATDRDRGRIGLRLAYDPAVAGKSGDELPADLDPSVWSPANKPPIAVSETDLKRILVGARFRNAMVVKTTSFGAFIRLVEGVDALLHITHVAPGRQLRTVEEVFRKGDKVDVVVVDVNDGRRVDVRLAHDPAVYDESKS